MSEQINRIKGRNEIQAEVETVEISETTFAPIASPNLTGIPTAPTAALATNTTQIATTAFVLANSGAGGVNPSLSNLTNPTSINQDLIPAGDKVQSLGLPGGNSWLDANIRNIYNRVIFDQSNVGSIDVRNRTLYSGTSDPMLTWATTGSIGAGGNKIVSIADPTSAQDAATKNYVDTHSANVLAFTSALTVGGAVTETVAVTGLLATDTLLAVSQIQSGAGAQALVGFNTQADNSLRLVWIGDPGPGAKVLVSVKR